MRRILIVDDEPYICTGIASIIEQAENPLWQVSGIAGTGAEAIEWLKTYHADICLTDIRMPVMDGLSLIKEAKEICPWIQWIIISSYNDFSYAKQGINLGITDYVLKPVDRNTLYDSIKKSEILLQKNQREWARSLLIEKMQFLQDLLSKWCDVILTNQHQKYPSLVIATVELMEQWVGKDYFLMEALSGEFVDLVAKQVKLPKVIHTQIIAGELGFASEALTSADSKFYFRLAAVMRMEKSILYLSEAIKSDQKHQNVYIINQIKQYMEEHYADKFTLDELADRIPMSRSYLSVLFKQGTGKTIWNYLIDIRMRKAKLLLLDHNLRMYELANQIGYENSEHFSKIFKDYYGITPKEYRRSLEVNSFSTMLNIGESGGDSTPHY